MQKSLLESWMQMQKKKTVWPWKFTDFRSIFSYNKKIKDMPVIFFKQM